MATPFEEWLRSDWKTMLRDLEHDQTVFTSELSIASAVVPREQKAAYLVWVQLGRPDAAWVEQMKPLYQKCRGPAEPIGIVL